MKRLLAVLLLAAAALGAADKPRVTRASLAALEKGFDRRVRQYAINDPVDLIGFARGIYLEGYGAVLTAEVDLAMVPISPFRPALSADQIGALRLKKVQRLAAVKQIMRETMVELATSLDAVPAGEQIVVAVSLSYQPWEQRDGLPGQIVMQARRQALLDFKVSGNEPALLAAIRMGEL